MKQKQSGEKKKKQAKFPNKLLVLGMTSFVIGAALLIWTLGVLPNLWALWPLFLIIAGLVFFYLTFSKKLDSRYLAPAIFFVLIGIFFILKNTIIGFIPLARIWPVFMTIAGLSLIPYCVKTSGYARIAVLIPALSFIFLSILFLPFSLEVVGTGFREFVASWWPMLFVFLGIALIVIYVYKSVRKKSKNP